MSGTLTDRWTAYNSITALCTASCGKSLFVCVVCLRGVYRHCRRGWVWYYSSVEKDINSGRLLRAVSSWLALHHSGERLLLGCIQLYSVTNYLSPTVQCIWQ